MKPLVTALIDTYNHERYIEQAVVSVLEQDFPSADVEIVVVDDGSTDRTPDILRKFTPRVRVLTKKNGGQASAFNAAFQQVNAEIIALLDGDDWWVKQKLELVVKAMERHPDAAAVGHGYYEFREATQEATVVAPAQAKFLNLATPQAARETRENWYFLQPSALTVRRRVLERALPIPEVLVFCADAAIATASMAMGIRVLPQPLSYYRHHSGNLFALDPSQSVRLRRRYQMEDSMFGVVHDLLLKLGVSKECISELIDEHWITLHRTMLPKFGGSRLKTFQTEMRFLRWQYKNPTLGYLAFKYLGVGAAALLLPPAFFYRARSWYGQKNLGRVRDWMAKSGRARSVK